MKFTLSVPYNKHEKCAAQLYYIYHEKWNVGWRARKQKSLSQIQHSNFSVSNNNNGSTYIDEFDAFKEIVFNLVIKKKRNETKRN